MQLLTLFVKSVTDNGVMKNLSTFPLRSLTPDRTGFDIDGVVADTAGAFLRLAAEQYGYTGLRLEDITEFEVERCLPMPGDIIDKIFDTLLRAPIGADLAPMPGAVAVLTRLADRAPITFVTARPERGPVEDWLHHILPTRVHAQIRLVAMGDHDGKSAHLHRLGLTHFIDDRAETCRALHAQGFAPIVFHQPWNAGRHHLPTVMNWRQIGEMFS